MQPTLEAYVEVGSRRVFAGALDWPGWCRIGRDETSALQALVAYGPRYARAIGRGVRGFKAPAGASALHVVERLEGNATTDFGAPAVAPAWDARPLDDHELARLRKLLQASWSAFDAAAEAASSTALRTGPRGGGRDLGAMRSHVLEADAAYLGALGGKHRKAGNADVAAELAGLRAAFLDALSSRARGEPPAPSRRKNPPWSPRYAMRRSAWHALDHAWEIEDRATPA